MSGLGWFGTSALSHAPAASAEGCEYRRWAAPELVQAPAGRLVIRELDWTANELRNSLGSISGTWKNDYVLEL